MWKITALNRWEIQTSPCMGANKAADLWGNIQTLIHALRVWVGEERDNKISDLASNGNIRREKGKGKTTSELRMQMVVWDPE